MTTEEAFKKINRFANLMDRAWQWYDLGMVGVAFYNRWYKRFEKFTIHILESYAKQVAKERVKDELTSFLNFLLKEGYCDADVYAEPPSAIDRYMHPKLRDI